MASHAPAADDDDPIPAQALALFHSLEAAFPTATLGDNRWYLVAIAALSYASPAHVATLYTHLISQPRYTTPSSRQALMRRLREALVKNVSIIGVCKPLEAIFAIAKIERAEDRDLSFSREHWASGPENHERGARWLDRIYLHNQAKTEDTLAAHKDFSWISTEITYGLYLSDHSILDAIDTEMVVLSGILIQNLPLETSWHLRGCRRVGVSMEDVEAVHCCIEMVAKFAGLKVNKVPRVKDIEHEV